MKLWYRCDMCSPDQSKSFDIPQEDPSLAEALELVRPHHKQNSPRCPAARAPGSMHALEEILLVRMVQ